MAGAAPSLADGEQPLIAGGVHAGNRWRLPLRGCDPADVTPAAVEHSVRALIDAEEMFSPFEHLYVTEIFHPDVYACMMHLMPPPEAYSRSHFLSNLHEDNDEIPVRYQTRIRQPGRIGPKDVKVARDYMNSTAQAFWAAWEEHYGSHSDFSRALMERFRGALEARTPAFPDEVDASPQFFQWDQPGTAFEPHSELRISGSPSFLPSRGLHARRYGDQVAGAEGQGSGVVAVRTGFGYSLWLGPSPSR